MKKILLLIMSLGIIITIFYFTTDDDSNNAYKIIKPKRQDIVIKVDVTGKVYCESLVSVATLANGEIKEFRVKAGDYLKKGDIIAVLDDKKEKNALKSEESKLTSLNDEKIYAGVQLQEMLNNYQVQEKLYKNGASSKEKYLSAKSSYFSAKSKLSSINANITQTKANIATLKENLDETIVKAPIDGTVISTYASVGQTINSRQNSAALIKMADLSKMEIRMQISQNDISMLKIGQNIKYTPLSDGGKTKEAKLSNIDDADLSVVDGASKDGAVYYYARYFVENDKDLKIGMDVQNIIEIETIKNALTLPINHISKDSKGFYVNVKDGKETIKKYIVLGKSDDFNIEIISGINDNDEVVVMNDKIRKR